MTKSVIIALVVMLIVLLLGAVILAIYALKLSKEQTQELIKLRRKLKIYEGRAGKQ